MKVIPLLLIALISYTLCENSGIDIAITSEFFKLLYQFDLNKLLQGKTIIDKAETSGTYIFNYDVYCENLFITSIVQPDNIEIEQETSEEGLPQVKVTFYNIQFAIQLAYLYVEYGIISDSFTDSTGSVSISSIEGKFHFNSEGKLVISELNVVVDSFDIDVSSEFIDFLIWLFSGLIQDEITKQLDNMGGYISDLVNNWVEGAFVYNIGYGIGFNFTNTLRPQLVQFFENIKLNEIGLKLLKSLFSKETLADTLKSDLTFGIKGTIYPYDNPELMPYIPPPGVMNFTTDLYPNELQILLSNYTLDSLLYMAQYNGYLHTKFTNETRYIFPWNLDTVGLQVVIPQYGDKYPGQNYEVEVQVYSSVSNHVNPTVNFNEICGTFEFNFNVDFYTYVSPDPVIDLSLNITAEIPFITHVKYGLLTINFGSLNVTNLDESINELNVPHDDLVALIGNTVDTYIMSYLKGYTQNIAIVPILNLATGMNFDNFKFETKDGFLLVSIAVDLDKH